MACHFAHLRVSYKSWGYTSKSWHVIFGFLGFSLKINHLAIGVRLWKLLRGRDIHKAAEEGNVAAVRHFLQVCWVGWSHQHVTDPKFSLINLEIVGGFTNMSHNLVSAEPVTLLFGHGKLWGWSWEPGAQAEVPWCLGTSWNRWGEWCVISDKVLKRFKRLQLSYRLAVSCFVHGVLLWGLNLFQD